MGAAQVFGDFAGEHDDLVRHVDEDRPDACCAGISGQVESLLDLAGSTESPRFFWKPIPRPIRITSRLSSRTATTLLL